jgi:hypothetical protein
MDENRVSGVTGNMSGKVEEGFTGDTRTQAEGAAKHVLERRKTFTARHATLRPMRPVLHAIQPRPSGTCCEMPARRSHTPPLLSLLSL